MTYPQPTTYAAYPSIVIQPVRSAGWVFAVGILGFVSGPTSVLFGAIERSNSYYDDTSAGIGAFLILFGILLWVVGIAFTIAGAVRSAGTAQRTHNMMLALMQRNADISAQLAAVQTALGVPPTTPVPAPMAVPPAAVSQPNPQQYAPGPQTTAAPQQPSGETASGAWYPTMPPGPPATYTATPAPTTPQEPGGPYNPQA